jgi:hypothetical protein
MSLACFGMGGNVTDYGSIVNVIQLSFDSEVIEPHSFDIKVIEQSFEVEVIEECLTI